MADANDSWSRRLTRLLAGALGGEPNSIAPRTMVNWHGEFHERADAADLDQLASAIGEFAGRFHSPETTDGFTRWYELYIEPADRRLFSLKLTPSVASDNEFTARVPFGRDRRRRTLTNVGWSLEAVSSGTRYYTRRFIGDDGGASNVVRALGAAYMAVYAERAEDLRWELNIVPRSSPTMFAKPPVEDRTNS